MVIQYLMASPESICTGNITQTKQVVPVSLEVCMSVYMCNNSGSRGLGGAMNLKESKEGYMGECGEKKGKEEMMQLHYNLQE